MRLSIRCKKKTKPIFALSGKNFFFTHNLSYSLFLHFQAKRSRSNCRSLKALIFFLIFNAQFATTYYKY